jgi:hypothetical protein
VVTAGTGTLVDQVYIPASASVKSASGAGILGKVLLSYSHLLGVGDNLSILFNGGGGTTDTYASVKWKEIR